MSSTSSRNRNTSITFADSSATDAFARLRVSDPVTKFDFKHVNETVHELVFSERLVGDGYAGIDTTTASELLSVGGTVGDLAVHQSKVRAVYEPGKSSLAIMTFNFEGQATGIEKKIGMFDDDNGLYLQLDGNGWSFNIKSNVAGAAGITQIFQNDWNIDQFDGTGPSRVQLNPDDAHILTIDYQWLGVGRVRFGFFIGGEFHYAHSELHANVDSLPYMRNPNLPFRSEIANVSSGTGSTMRAICISQVSEGSSDPFFITRSADRGLSDITTSSTLVPVISVRLKESETKSVVKIDSISVMVGDNTNFRWELNLNPTITGGDAASWVDETNSTVEYDISRTGTVSGGTTVASGYGSAQARQVIQSVNTVFPLSADLDENRDEFVLAVHSVTGNNKSFYGSIGWREFA